MHTILLPKPNTPQFVKVSDRFTPAHRTTTRKYFVLSKFQIGSLQV